MDVEEKNEKRYLRTSSSFKTVTREIVMKYVEEMDTCTIFSETESDVEERIEKRRLKTSSSFRVVTKGIVMKYLAEEEEQRKLETHNMTTEEEMDSCEHEVSTPLSVQRKLYPVSPSEGSSELSFIYTI
ncbi:hypothetical protein MHYP_G00084480 [Metynnis hypsauchen]